MSAIIDYNNNIFAIDANYVAPGIAAVHIIVDGDKAAVVDTGANNSVPGIMAALAALGLEAEQVAYVILTHIHLDHAGGCGELMRRLPSARLVVHPKGSFHMVNPARLIAGTQAVYGADKAQRLYGDIQAVDKDRVIEAQHEQCIALNKRELLLLHTPGHALHHICIVDQATGHVFSGDTFGLSYRQFDRGDRQFIFATTTPVNFDADALHQSVDLLASLKPDAIYLTHFSQVRNIPRLAEELKSSIDLHVDIARRAPGSGDERIAHIVRELRAWVSATSKKQHWGCQGADAVKLLAMDIDLNAQGLEVWLQRYAHRQK